MMVESVSNGSTYNLLISYWKTFLFYHWSTNDGRKLNTHRKKEWGAQLKELQLHEITQN